MDHLCCIPTSGPDVPKFTPRSADGCAVSVSHYRTSGITLLRTHMGCQYVLSTWSISTTYQRPVLGEAGFGYYTHRHGSDHIQRPVAQPVTQLCKRRAMGQFSCETLCTMLRHLRVHLPPPSTMSQDFCVILASLCNFPP